MVGWLDGFLFFEGTMGDKWSGSSESQGGNWLVK